MVSQTDLDQIEKLFNKIAGERNRLRVRAYSIGINGCIYGILRKIKWLETSRTNSDPHLIEGYYMTVAEAK